MKRTFIELAQEAQIHKETYSATLKSVLRVPGTKQSFAEQVGISPQYLSYLLDPDDPRTPGPDVAEKIAAALPLDPEQRESLFEHLLCASQRRLEQERALRAEPSDLSLTRQVAMLGDKHHLTSLDPLSSKSHYLAVRDASRSLLKKVNPYIAPLAAVQVCFVLHDTQCLLHRPEEALYHAKLVRLLLQSLDQKIYRSQREYIDQLEFQALRAEAVAYFNLKLPRLALARCEEAKATNAMRERPEACMPHLYRDKINILSYIARFALSEAEGLVDQVKSMCQQGRALDPTWDFLIRRSLGRAYLEYGNLAKASRVLEALLSDLHRIPQLGLIHKTIFITTYAKLLRQQGRTSEWQEALKLALRIADDTEVTLEFAVMRESLGPTMGPLLKDLHLLPTEETAQEGRA